LRSACSVRPAATSRKPFPISPISCGDANR
jgi:hypothetical protein